MNKQELLDLVANTWKIIYKNLKNTMTDVVL